MYMYPRYISAFLLLIIVYTGSIAIAQAQAVAQAQAPQPPAFSHPAGTFTQPFSLSLEADANTIIYYTTNGDIPGTSDHLYEADSPIPVSGSVLIRARAFADGSEPSEVVSRIYSQLHPGVADFSSNIPLVVVHQFDDVMHEWGDYRSTVNFSVIDVDDEGRATLLTDNLHLHSRSESNYRGSSSLGFPKKQFGVRLIDEYGENRNEPVLGMPSENNWIMSAPYDDKSLIRNAIAYQVSRDMGRYAPRTRFVELFLHQGDGPLTADHYHGVYMLTERIKWDNNRVNIAKLTREDNSEPEISGGYIINYDRETHFGSSRYNTGFALIRPSVEDITPQQLTWISNYTGDLESALFGPEFRDPETGYAAYLDPGSFVDYHLITETFKEMDGFRLSTMMHKDRGGKMIMGPIWDYNLSSGNYNGSWSGAPTGWYHDHLNETQYLNGWYTRLFQDPEFSRKYSDRWWQLRPGPLSTEHITGMIRDYAELLDEAQKRNFERWPILGQHVWVYSRDGYPTYGQEIDFLVDWFEQRLNWIDSQMPEPTIQPESRLRYFWFFGVGLVNNTPLESIDATFSLVHQAVLHFQSALDGYPFNPDHAMWRKASMERRNRPTGINYHPDANEGRPFDASAMRGLQIRQPFSGSGGENTLVFDVPATGLENGVIFSFAAMDEGAASSMIIDYSTTSGTPDWTTDGMQNGAYTLSLSDEYQFYSVDFSGIDEISGNPDFRIRIRFGGDSMTADNGGRVTFNNFSLKSAPDTATNPDEDKQRVYTYQLGQNYPNPFNPGTVIRYELQAAGEVYLEVYDVLGRRIAVLVDEMLEAGNHQAFWNAAGQASGVYIYRLRSGDFMQSRQMTLIK